MGVGQRNSVVLAKDAQGAPPLAKLFDLLLEDIGVDHQRAVAFRTVEKIKPLLEWNNNMGCVNITYNAPLKKYIMCVTDGGNTYSKMNTYLMEADEITGEWKMITYMKDFGEQAYFVNIPSKFISKDGKTAWLLYSGNYWDSMNGESVGVNPPGSHYGMVFQKIQLLD